MISMRDALIVLGALVVVGCLGFGLVCVMFSSMQSRWEEQALRLRGK